MVRTGRSARAFYRNRVFLKRFSPGPATGFLRWGGGIGSFLWRAPSRAGGRGRRCFVRGLAVSAPHPRITVRTVRWKRLTRPPAGTEPSSAGKLLEIWLIPVTFSCRAESSSERWLLACSVPNMDHVSAVPTRIWGPTACRPSFEYWNVIRSGYSGGMRPDSGRLRSRPSAASSVGGLPGPAVTFLWNQAGALSDSARVP